MKVLIVDDSRFAQIIIERHLKELVTDINFVFASDGEDGIKKYKEERPDYCFVDLLMPGVNGKELIEKIRIFDKKPKIFVVSADVQKFVRAEVESLGILGFINKPFDKEKAREVLKIIEGDNYE